jgi:lipopolysaccharide export system permease protein
MKILDKYLLKTFFITFASVFIILLFIFILQTVWLFISELAGKDLDLILIFKFLMYKMPSLIPLVLPLSVLLASIMTFGDLAENYEFAAMKSAGISFMRSIRTLIFLILGISISAFIFANNVIPYAEYNFNNFRRNLAQVKPAMAIAEGQFSDVGSFNIKVNKKKGEKGQFLEEVTIHKKSNLGEGAKTVIKSKKGELVSSEGSNVLQLVLSDGYYYEDIKPKDFADRDKIPFAKAYFKKYNINIDLTNLNKVDVDKDQGRSSDEMLNISELIYTSDSLSTSLNKEVVSVADNIYQRVGITSVYQQPDSLKIKKPKTPNLLSFLNKNDKSKILEIANSDTSSSSQSIEIFNTDFAQKKKDINNYWLAFFDKFVIAFACIFMFFIGAPLGSIIRKGGLGLPIVFAMVIFITYHFTNTFGRKLAQQSGIPVFLGSWMSTIILLPLAIYLTRLAINDSGSINFDVITEPIKNFYIKYLKRKKISE